MHTPTVETWSLRVEQELSPNTSLSVGYVGNHGYHELIGVDENAPQPIGCAGAQCQTTLTTFSSTGTVTTTPVTLPTGTPYIALTAPVRRRETQHHLANTWTWMSEGDSSYNALQVDFNRRFSQGLTLRGIYTWSKVLDDGDSYNATAAGNDAGAAVESLQRDAPIGDSPRSTCGTWESSPPLMIFPSDMGNAGSAARTVWRRRGQRLDGQQHCDPAIRISFHAPTELQPFERRRHAQSRPAFPQPQFHRRRDAGSRERVVQSAAIVAFAQQ